MDLSDYCVVWKRLCSDARSADQFRILDTTDTRRYVQVVCNGRIIVEGPLEELINLGFLGRIADGDASQQEASDAMERSD